MSKGTLHLGVRTALEAYREDLLAGQIPRVTPAGSGVAAPPGSQILTFERANALIP